MLNVHMGYGAVWGIGGGYWEILPFQPLNIRSGHGKATLQNSLAAEERIIIVGCIKLPYNSFNLWFYLTSVITEPGS